jgi:hypothetical protein
MNLACYGQAQARAKHRFGTPQVEASFMACLRRFSGCALQLGAAADGRAAAVARCCGPLC